MGHLHVAKYLIEGQQCDPVCRRNDGQIPLHFACYRGHLNIVQYLIEEQHINHSNKVNILISGIPLHLSLNEYFAKLYDKHQYNRAYRYGWTPIHLACQEGHLARCD